MSSLFASLSQNDKFWGVASILVVDDTPPNVRLIAATLEQAMSCKISIAQSGEEAIAAAKDVRPDLVLLDVMMPGLDGFETCRRLKADPKTSGIPVIFLTALTEASDLKAGFDAGGADYVTKPFKAVELVSRVNNMLRLVEARKTIEAKNAELRRLLQVLCHDLANPLAAIHGFLEIARDDPGVVAEVREELESITAQALDLIDVVRRMRSFEEGGASIPTVPVELARAANDALRLAGDRLRAKNVSAAVDIPPGLAALAEPASLAGSVLANLITNAIKFSPRGSRIRIAATPDGNGSVELSVRDPGIGMDDEIVRKLDEGGAAKSRPGTEGETGNGFGLPLAKMFVEAYGGSLEIRSSDGLASPDDRGTTVVLRLASADLAPA